VNPFYSRLDFDSGMLLDYDIKTERRLSDIKPYVEDKEFIEQMIKEENRLVYEVLQKDVPKEEGQVQHCVTIIKPEDVNGECFFTKGHYHANDKSAEIYMGLKGKGVLVLQKNDQVKVIEMQEGTVAYIPPMWAHRTVNVGDEDFIFMSFWPGDSGYNYEKLQGEGIKLRIYKTEEGYKKVRG